MNYVKTTIHEEEAPLFCISCNESDTDTCFDCGTNFEVGEDIYCVDDGEEHLCVDCREKRKLKK